MFHKEGMDSSRVTIIWRIPLDLLTSRNTLKSRQPTITARNCRILTLTIRSALSGFKPGKDTLERTSEHIVRYPLALPDLTAPETAQL